MDENNKRRVRLVEREIESIAETYREGLFQSGSVEDYRRRRITDICASVCFSVVEQVRAGHISQISPEIAFGRKGDLPPIEMEAGGQKIYIEGVIDRVDYLTDGRVKIVDYKTGKLRYRRGCGRLQAAADVVSECSLRKRQKTCRRILF